MQSCSKSDTNPVIPKLTTADASSITQLTASAGGTISDDGGAGVTARGVCWSTSSGPTTDNNKTNDGTGIGVFVSSLTGLTPGTLYHARAYATNKIGVAYGNEITFTTAAINAATLTTTAISGITSSGAQSGGDILTDGGSTITARGICWNISTGPTITNNLTTNGTGTGTFVSALAGLSPGVAYYVRAYATNAAGTSYGNEVSFTASAVLATLTSTTVSSVTSNTASSGGNISDDGGATITARGVCYGTSSSPTIANSITNDGTGTGIFSSSLTGLKDSTTYYVRAYATNSVGTAYGAEFSFTTTAVRVTIVDAKETSIFNNVAGNAANANYGAGASQVFQVGFANTGSIYARSLIQFDVSSIPSDAVIDSVGLQLTTGQSGTSVPTIYMYRLTQGWTEGTTGDACAYNGTCNTFGSTIAGGGNDATWNVTDYSTSNAWVALGGSFSSTVSATSADTKANLNTFTSANLAADVQAWVSGSASNYGWIMKIDEASNTSGSGKMKRYVSREGVNAGGAPAGDQPKLFIKYH